MARRVPALRLGLLALMAVVWGGACDASEPAARIHTGVGGDEEDERDDKGSGGYVPRPDPNFDPDSLLDSGAPSPNEDAVCEGVAIGTGAARRMPDRGGSHAPPQAVYRPSCGVAALTE